MNFTSTSTIRKSVKTRYVVGIAGAALAISAAVGGLTELGGSSSETPVTQPKAAVPTQAEPSPGGSLYWDAPLSPIVGETRTGYGGIASHGTSVGDNFDQPSRLLVYIVGSETEKRTLEEDLTRYPDWFGQSSADVKVRVIAIKPGADEFANLDQLLPEAIITNINGPHLKLMDMR